MRRIVTLLFVTLLFATVLVAIPASCTSNATSDPRADHPPTTRQDPREAAVRKVLTQYNEAFRRAEQAPGAGTVALDMFASGEFLASAQSVIAGLRAKAEVARESPEALARQLTVLSIRFDGDRATAETCFVNDDQLVDQATGRVLNARIATYRETYRLLLGGGQWRIDALLNQRRSEGVSACVVGR